MPERVSVSPEQNRQEVVDVVRTCRAAIVLAETEAGGFSWASIGEPSDDAFDLFVAMQSAIDAYLKMVGINDSPTMEERYVPGEIRKRS